jgi:hypothetical protein
MGQTQMTANDWIQAIDSDQTASCQPLAAVALTAEIGVIDLDPAGEALDRVSFKHDLLQLVFELPGGGLRHPEATIQLDAGDPLLGLGELIDGSKP